MDCDFNTQEPDYENCECRDYCPGVFCDGTLDIFTCGCTPYCPDLFCDPISQFQDYDACMCVDYCPDLVCGADEIPDYTSCQCLPNCDPYCDLSMFVPNYEYCTCDERCPFADTYCPNANSEFDYFSCSCQCLAISCEEGQYQDPVTCECVDTCPDLVCMADETKDFGQCKCIPPATSKLIYK